MYIYNVTVNIEPHVQEQWLSWMHNTHIPEMLATGKFLNARVCRVLVEEETGGITYAVQYTAHNRDALDRYYREDAPRLRQQTLDRFSESLVAFRTELEIISEHGV